MPYPAAGLVLTGLGLFLVGLGLYAQRRIVTGIRRAADSGPPLTIRAEPSRPTGYMVVVVSGPDLPWDYSWKSLPSETPVDPMVRFLRNLPRSWQGRARLSAARPWSGPGQADGEVRPHRWVMLRTADQVFFPVSPAEPVLSLRSWPVAADADADDLLRAHSQLLAAYADVLNRVRMLPRFIRPPGRGDAMPRVARLRTLLCWRVLVRMHAESHVRRQLRELASAYIRRQFAAALPNGGLAEYRGPADLAGQCKLLGESLSNGRRTASFLVTLTVLIPLIPIVIKTHQVQVGALLTAILGYLLYAIVFTPGIAALTAFGDAFQCKRRLFGGAIQGEPAGQAGPRLSMLLRTRYSGCLPSLRNRSVRLICGACAVVLLIWAAGATFSVLESSRFNPPSLSVWMILVFSTGLPLLALARAVWRRRDAER